MLTRQTLQQGHKPADQAETGFDDRQFAAAVGGAGVGGNGHGFEKIARRLRFQRINNRGFWIAYGFYIGNKPTDEQPRAKK